MTFGIDVSKYQSGLDWNKIKKSGVSFVIIRIGYRGYGAAGNLVKDYHVRGALHQRPQCGVEGGRVFLYTGRERGRGAGGGRWLQLGAEWPDAGLPHLL
ncbi:MAG: hypothetical protein ACLVJH_13455 [Faecalibacterium prausnitzii]